MKGYILVDVHSSEITISRNVKFFDLEFPFHSTSLSLVPNTHICIESRATLFPKQHQDIDAEVTDTSSPDTEGSEILDVPIEPEENRVVEAISNQTLRKSQRISKPPTHLFFPCLTM